MVPSCSTERAGPNVLMRVTCGSLYSPGSSNVGSVRKRNPAISMRAVGPPMSVILGVFMDSSQRASLVSVRISDTCVATSQPSIRQTCYLRPKFMGQAKDDLEHLLSVGFKEPNHRPTHGYPYSQTCGATNTHCWLVP